MLLLEDHVHPNVLMGSQVSGKRERLHGELHTKPHRSCKESAAQQGRVPRFLKSQESSVSAGASFLPAGLKSKLGRSQVLL